MKKVLILAIAATAILAFAGDASAKDRRHYKNDRNCYNDRNYNRYYGYAPVRYYAPPRAYYGGPAYYPYGYRKPGFSISFSTGRW
jgi:hypothetical protein